MALSMSPSSICCYLLFALTAFLSFGLITDPAGTLVDGFKMPGTITVGMRHMGMIIGSTGMINCYLCAWASQSDKEIRKNCLMAMLCNMPGIWAQFKEPFLGAPAEFPMAMPWPLIGLQMILMILPIAVFDAGEKTKSK